jgi:uncharacterized protein YbaR (Trm112 family)
MIERYRRNYDRKYQEIQQRYEKYEKIPESHPKYIETWNFYWLEEFYKLDENDRDATKCDFTPKWRGYWEKRSLELRYEEELKMRVDLREQMDMLVDPEDKDKLKVIADKEKVMIKEKSPSVPIITSSGFKAIKIPSNFSHLNSEKQTIAVKEEEEIKQVPAHIKSLTNSDLIVLFGNINKVSDDLRDELIELMNFMEVNEPERYRDLLKICLNDIDSYSTQETPQSAKLALVDSEESYTLDDVLATAQDNLEYGPAMTPERFQDEEIIDLTSD